MNIIFNESVLSELKNSNFLSNNFIKPSKYGCSTPAVIIADNIIHVGFIPGFNTKVLRTKFPIPENDNTWLVSTYLNSIKGTIFGLISI